MLEEMQPGDDHDMTMMDNARGLLATALDEGRKPQDRLAALLEANDARSKAKTGWGKLGAPEGFNMAAYLEDLRDLVKAGKPKAETVAVRTAAVLKKEKKPAKEPKAVDPDRGGIGRLVNELLTETEDDYATIVAKVVAKYPDAKTTARSVASVAADLRRDGVDVKTRRKGKKAA